jgi:threonine/homoserine/homoserine lactone efflux protein
MGESIGEILPLAVGVAISPIPIIAVILMLFSDRARSNGLAFLVGWIVGIGGGLAVLIAIGSTQDLSSGREPSDSVSWVKLILGALMLLLAARQWRARPRPGAEPAMPGWMRRIDGMRAPAALGLGIVLSIVNPKNLLLVVGAAVAIAQADAGTTDEVVASLVFTLIAVCTVAIPTLGYLVAGPRVQPSLDRAKTWLSANDAVVMSVLLLVIGAVLLGKGLGPLI